MTCKYNSNINYCWFLQLMVLIAELLLFFCFGLHGNLQINIGIGAVKCCLAPPYYLFSVKVLLEWRKYVKKHLEFISISTSEREICLHSDWRCPFRSSYYTFIGIFLLWNENIWNKSLFWFRWAGRIDSRYQQQNYFTNTLNNFSTLSNWYYISIQLLSIAK